MEIGDIVNILDVYHQSKRYNKYIIIQILDKKLYNMYLCKNIKLGYKTTFTDMDLNCMERNKIRRVYGNKSITTV